MTAPAFSIVIATRDRAPILDRALASIARQRGAPAFETIVADNGSSDATAEVLQRHALDPALALRSVYVARPNRGAARNAGVAAARGAHVLFVDDDVLLPPGFVAAHAGAQARSRYPHAVSGPILNIADERDRPAPGPANYSGAFFCTCNVSVARSALLAAGGFDERFDLYGWEDTELGLRLRRRDVRRTFAWDAYLWHVKPPSTETLDVLVAKVVERAQMAARFVQKEPGVRAKLATGAYSLNLLRAALVAPARSAPLYRSLANASGLPRALREFGRAQLLDVAYTTTLRRELRATNGRGA